MKLDQALIDRFREKGGLTEHRAKELLLHCGDDLLQFAQMLIRQGNLDRDVAGTIVGDALGFTYLNLEKTLFRDDVVNMLAREIAERHEAIAVYQFGGAVTTALSHPEDRFRVSTLESIIRRPLDIHFAFPDEIQAAIRFRYEPVNRINDLAASFDFERLKNLTPEQLVLQRPVVEMCESFITMALRDRASDVHIEPKEQDCAVRFRIDGVLAERLRLPKPLALPLVSRIKVMGGMNVLERRTPQEGQIRYETPTNPMDIRVSTLPTVYGEKAVLSFIGSARDNISLNLDKLTIASENLADLKRALGQPSGILLVAGPASSGKTTTLYSALNYLDKPDVNISTVEEPVEYEIPTFNQAQVNPRTDQGFAGILRAILRQDPDVIMVSDIRDKETAEVAVGAALAGRLILTSIYTKNALQAIPRLVDMGVEPFAVAPSLLGILSQRLVRRICEYCKIADETIDESRVAEYVRWHEDDEPPCFFRGSGCPRCANTGFQGRIAIHEFVAMDHVIRNYLLQGRGYNDMRAYIHERGFRDMRFDGLVKALQGLTTVDEVLRVTSDL